MCTLIARSIINPLIYPWWIYTPCRMRKAIHYLATGLPLPPDGCRKYRPQSYIRRPNLPFRRSQKQKPKQKKQQQSFLSFLRPKRQHIVQQQHHQQQERQQPEQQQSFQQGQQEQQPSLLEQQQQKQQQQKRSPNPFSRRRNSILN